MGNTSLLDQSLLHEYPILRLPEHPRLQIGALAALFSVRSTSYKYLFFLALLDTVSDRALHGSVLTRAVRISLHDLIVAMLQFGWYPHRFFKLCFGKTDQVGKALDKLDFVITENAVTDPHTLIQLRAAIETQFRQIRARNFARFVPYRLLTPFFRQALKDLPDQQKNAHIIALSKERAQSARPAIYHFSADTSELIVHPEWVRYFLDNYALIRGWGLFHWARYLQRHNPEVPAMLDKIEPPQMRASLQTQRDYWRDILQQVPLHCIYNQTPLDIRNFSLDHFLPWSFICHDNLWNLIPADPGANSAKGRQLPDERLIRTFALQQHKGLRVYRGMYQHTKKWQKVSSVFIEGLSLTENELLDKHALVAAYHHKLRPLMALARNMGY